MNSVAFWKYSGVRGQSASAAWISDLNVATAMLSLTIKSSPGESVHHQSAPPAGTFEAVMQLTVWFIFIFSGVSH